jgi:acyl transferase domain-containing protein
MRHQPNSNGEGLAASAIAVVGMAGRFPGARNLEEFWNNLRGGIESLRILSDQELRVAGVTDDLIHDPAYVKACAILDGIELFDASFFGISPKDAAIMDPQHRHFLECAWEALEHAGYVVANFQGSIGVYAGSGMNSYMLFNLLTNAELVENTGMFLIRQTGNDKDVLATRVSYQLNLQGPSINVQTACSTSLVAIHMACQSLLSHECDMALAGGVTIEIPHGLGYLYREGDILSRDGHCRAFDASASGTIFGSGAAVVVLRRLKDALRDRDTIHAVIRGSAINNDGARKVGYLAPSVHGQAEVITEALAVSEVDAESISYVETHGTGTRVGDPIELNALTQAFRQTTRNNGYCAVGSVKTNIGHLDTAAGVAGFIKTVLALKHRELPPSLHFVKPNPLIDVTNSPFYVNDRLREWEAPGGVRRAGVTSLGIGGTNAHVILEEAPERIRSGRSRPWQVLILSAKSASSLDNLISNLATYIGNHQELRLSDVSFTCQLGRKQFQNRRMWICQTLQEARNALAKQGSGSASGGTATVGDVAFLFPGQGSQHMHMARELYSGEPVFRDQVNHCSELLRRCLGLDLVETLYPKKASEAANWPINETYFAQPALFVIEYALAKLWMSWGVLPKCMLGHSIGEYVAACLAGVFSLKDALEIVATRGRLMQSLQPGAMTAAQASEKDLSPFLGDDLVIAAINSPNQCVVSGRTETIHHFERDLSVREIPFLRLRTSHAFHSPMVDPILRRFAGEIGRIGLNEPHIPYLSNLTGTWVRVHDATDPEYWVNHLRGTVRFAEALEELFRNPSLLLVEVGPGNVLSTLANQHPKKPKHQEALHSLPHASEVSRDYEVLLNTLGRLWVEGAPVDWAAFRAHDAGYRVPLPSYPFERQRHWIEPGSARGATTMQPATSIPNEWFQQITWKRAPMGPTAQRTMISQWLVFTDSELGPEMRTRLEAEGHDVVTVEVGNHFARVEDGRYSLRPGRRDDYDRLVTDLTERGILPDKIVHLWALRAPSGLDAVNEFQSLCFESLLFLAQAFGKRDISGFRLAVVSNRLQSVNGESVLHPETAVLIGPCKLIPEEYSGVECQNIDIAFINESSVAHVVNEIVAPQLEPTVAYRLGERWVPSVAKEAQLAAPGRNRLREKGVYLITGGLGGIGMAVAECLAKEFRARLVLIGRTALPPREQWETFRRLHGPGDLVCWRIQKVLELEKLGAEVLLIAADVANYHQMSDAIAQTQARYGALHGVFHAAGVLGDGLIQLKTPESAQAVLAPKITGTLVLDRLLEKSDLDLLVLFSSVSAFAPPVGQVDYAAANSFLNAFAEAKRAGDRRLTVAISWGLWTNARAAVSLSAPSAITGRVHPLLGDLMWVNIHEMIYSRGYNCDTDWILKEHRFRSGEALFPGTGYLEMAFTALGGGSRPLELREISFVSPLIVGATESMEVRFLLQRNKTNFRFCVLAESDSDASWQEYASGRARYLYDQTAPTIRLNEISANCSNREIGFANQRTKQEKYFQFGPRWGNLKRIQLGRNEALVTLELDQEFRRDLETCCAHPALLDLATGAALYLIPGYESSDDLYLPFSYEKLTIWSRLPARCYSHIRFRHRNGEQAIVIFDVSIIDVTGCVLIDIEGFAVRRISDPIHFFAESTQRAVGARRAMQVTFEGELLGQRLEEGLSSGQGIAALLRILSTSGIGPHVIVSRTKPHRQLEPAKVHSSQFWSGRANAKVAPLDDIEDALAHWWSEVLGIDRIGMQDDFFELGGHSIVALRLFAKI